MTITISTLPLIVGVICIVVGATLLHNSGGSSNLGRIFIANIPYAIFGGVLFIGGVFSLFTAFL